MIKAPRLIPALVAFPETAARSDAWGRLLELSPVSARLLTRAVLTRRDRIFLSFDAADEHFEALPAQVSFVEADADGYYAARLDFMDEPAKRRLSKLLLELGAE